MKFFVAIFSLFLSLQTWAASSRSTYQPTFTYDLGVSSGTRNDKGYSEIHLGLSWYLMEHFVWRNSIFTRFGTGLESTGGLDSSARFVYNTPRDESGFGVGFFAGPGYRFSSKENTGIFGEAGLTLKLAGLAAGVGVKSIYYSSPGNDSSGRENSKSDTVVFLILAAGGAF
jgi:hypothetical protein